MNMLIPYDRNIPFNALPELPPAADLNDDPEILKKLVTASRALAAVNANVLRLPNPKMLINTIALQEAKTSTAIENIFTTEDELYKAISGTAQEMQADAATKEVLRYREALWAGYGDLSNDHQIGENMIINIYQKIKNTSAGYRPPQAMVVIKRGQSELRPGETIYTPPRGEGIIERFMNNLLEYLNNDDRFPGDPLIKMCVAHYQFEAIHPFSDGNGRTGRILNLLYLIQKGLLSQPVLYLSKHIIITKEDYYHNLAAVSQRGQWKSWVLYMLHAVEQTAILTNNLIDQIIGQMEATLDYAKKHIKWYNKEVNETLFSQPYIKPSILGQTLQKSSRTTLTKYMDQLVTSRLLSPKRDGKEVYYINDDLIRILEG